MLGVKGKASRPLRRSIILLPLILLLLASCVRRNKEPDMLLGSEVTLSGAARLLCTDECRQRGQCGTVDERWVVLLNSGGPATTSHDLTFPADSEVLVNQQQMAQVKGISGDSTPWRAAFYQVSAPERGAGWVAGWCIAQEIVP